MNSQKSTNQAQEFLMEYRDVLALEVFKHSSAEYRIYLEKLIHRRNSLLEEELTDNSFKKLRAMEEQIKIMLGFFGIVEATLKIFSEKAYEHLNFDAKAWARYKLIEQENAMWAKLFNQKLLDKEHAEK